MHRATFFDIMNPDKGSLLAPQVSQSTFYYYYYYFVVSFSLFNIHMEYSIHMAASNLFYSRSLSLYFKDLSNILFILYKNSYRTYLDRKIQN